MKSFPLKSGTGQHVLEWLFYIYIYFYVCVHIYTYTYVYMCIYMLVRVDMEKVEPLYTVSGNVKWYSC